MTLEELQAEDALAKKTKAVAPKPLAKSAMAQAQATTPDNVFFGGTNPVRQDAQADAKKLQAEADRQKAVKDEADKLKAYQVRKEAADVDSLGKGYADYLAMNAVKSSPNERKNYVDIAGAEASQLAKATEKPVAPIAQASKALPAEKPIVKSATNPQVEIYGQEQAMPKVIEQVKTVAKSKGVPWYVVLADILEGAGKGYLGDKSATKKQMREDKAYQQELRDAELAEASRIRAEETALQNQRIEQQLAGDREERAAQDARLALQLENERKNMLTEIASREKIAGMGSKPLNAQGAYNNLYGGN